MRWLAAAAVAALAFGGSSSAAPSRSAIATSSASSTLVITGHGYGHGVGMGQWGAYGMASKGMAYDKILGFYYPGTQLGQSPVKSVRVLLGDTAGKVTITSTEPFKVKDATGVVHQIASGQLTTGPSLAVQFDPSAPPQALPGPLTVQPGKAPLSYRKPYRGSIQLQVVGTHLQVVNVLSLDNYVKGVVTGESPRDWPSQWVVSHSRMIACRPQSGSGAS